MTLSHSSDRTFAFVSDIHLAHPRTDTHHILERLRETFPDNEETAKLSAIFLNGDVFDRLMTLPQEEVDAIHDWVADFLSICVKYDILIRVLEGTPSHDWRQSKIFVNVNKSFKTPADLKYVDTLSIEVIEKLGDLSVLYVPDEWNDDASATYKQVRELLSLHGMDKVDLACMHGSFDYQLPIESIKNHDLNNYFRVVNHFISIGHVHIRSERKGPKGVVCLAQGSLDRLSHGEESAKGHYRACIHPDGNYHWFVENTRARLYRTIDCRELDVEETIGELATLEGEPDKSNFRLVLRRGSVVHHGIKDVRARFPQFVITTQLEELKTIEESATSTLPDIVIRPITVTSTNVGNLVKELLARRTDLDPSVTHDQILAVLDKYKE